MGNFYIFIEMYAVSTFLKFDSVVKRLIKYPVAFSIYTQDIYLFK